MDEQKIINQLLTEIETCLGFGIFCKHTSELSESTITKVEIITFSRNLTPQEDHNINILFKDKEGIQSYALVDFKKLLFIFESVIKLEDVPHEEIQESNVEKSMGVKEQLLNILNNDLSEPAFTFKCESSRVLNPTVIKPNILLSHQIGTEIKNKLQTLDYIENFDINASGITVNFKVTDSDLITYIDDTATKVIEGLQSGRDRKIVTVDYDHTFCHSHTKKAIKEFMRRGYEIFILTYRFDELNKHRYPINPTNDDMYQALEDFGIGKEKIIFMNSELKGKYLSYTPNVLYHIDDREEELQSIKRYAPHVRLIKCTDIELRDYFTDTVII